MYDYVLLMAVYCNCILYHIVYYIRILYHTDYICTFCYTTTNMQWDATHEDIISICYDNYVQILKV